MEFFLLSSRGQRLENIYDEDMHKLKNNNMYQEDRKLYFNFK